MRNTFIVGAKYNAAQNISKKFLAYNHAPLYYSGIIYVGIEDETSEVPLHTFLFEGEEIQFDDEFINTDRLNSNDIVIVESLTK